MATSSPGYSTENTTNQDQIQRMFGQGEGFESASSWSQYNYANLKNLSERDALTLLVMQPDAPINHAGTLTNVALFHALPTPLTPSTAS